MSPETITLEEAIRLIEDKQGAGTSSRAKKTKRAAPKTTARQRRRHENRRPDRRCKNRGRLSKREKIRRRAGSGQDIAEPAYEPREARDKTLPSRADILAFIAGEREAFGGKTRGKIGKRKSPAFSMSKAPRGSP